MDIHKLWEKALSKTEIVRSRVQSLQSYASTHVPYVFLAESAINVGDSVVRKGEVIVEKPSLILPSNNAQFEGFNDAEHSFEPDAFLNFLMVRGIRFPSMKYNNKTDSLDIHEGKLTGAIEHYKSLLEREENTSTGLIVGPEDCWSFSVLIFTCSQAFRSAEADIERLLEEYKRRSDEC